MARALSESDMVGRSAGFEMIFANSPHDREGRAAVAGGPAEKFGVVAMALDDNGWLAPALGGSEGSTFSAPWLQGSAMTGMAALALPFSARAMRRARTFTGGGRYRAASSGWGTGLGVAAARE